MKNFRILIFGAIVLSLVACNGKDDLDKGKGKSKTKFVEKTIKEETAINSLMSLLSALDLPVDPATIELRAIGRNEIMDMIKKQDQEENPGTKSELISIEEIMGWKIFPRTLVYVAKFRSGGGKEEGRALLAGNTALNAPVICLSEMQAVETKSADGSAGFIDGDDEFLLGMLAISVVGDYNDGSHMPSEAPEMSLYSNALVKTRFNDDAGSVVMSLMQIMAHQGRPEVSALYSSEVTWEDLSVIGTPEWSGIAEEDQAERLAVAAGIASVLGNEENCNSGQDEEGLTVGYTVSAQRTLNKYGYSTTILQGGGKASLAKIDAQLKAGKPVYMDVEFCGVGRAGIVDALCGDMYHVSLGCGDASGYVAKSVFSAAESFRISDFAIEIIRQGLGGEWDFPADCDFRAYFRAIVY